MGDWMDAGWTPVGSTNPFAEDDETDIDPLRQQMKIIRRYLRQAVDEGRLEAVAALEKNLRELQAELDAQ